MCVPHSTLPLLVSTEKINFMDVYDVMHGQRQRQSGTRDKKVSTTHNVPCSEHANKRDETTDYIFRSTLNLVVINTYRSTLILAKFCYIRSHRYSNLSNWTISQPKYDGFSSNLGPFSP